MTSDPDPETLDLYRRATALLNDGRHSEALTLFDVILARLPRFSQAHAARGLALAGSGADDAAVAAMGEALTLDPRGAPPMLIHLGYQFLQLGRPTAALAAFGRLLAVQPGDLAATQGYIMALIAANRFEEALPGLAALLRSMPGIDYLPGVYFHAQLQCCDWSTYQASAAAIAAGVRGGRRVDAPHAFLAHNDSPAEQRRCAEIFVADRCTAEAPPAGEARLAHTPAPRQTSRLRIAYLSADLRDHAVGQLLAGVFEAHDRGRFETYAFSCGADDGSELRRRLERSFEHFIDVTTWSDERIAKHMTALGIDVAIDLGGHSATGRTRVLSYRPAPLQMSLLGYPGTLATSYVDYLFADPVVVPPGQGDQYAEKLLYLPDSCLPTDGAPGKAPMPTREEAGLPQAGAVYCCFNAPYKISPLMFDVWMRILDAVPQSVLWLRDANEAARRNLRAEAARRGVDSTRLIFAARTTGRAEHYARFSLADVFLDTSPYNAHTTAAEALGVTVPIVTLKSANFAGRVAASLLESCGMGELAVESAAEYETRAIELGSDPQRLAELKERLRTAASHSALFDPPRYCRSLEAALSMAWSRFTGGEAAATFSVARA